MLLLETQVVAIKLKDSRLLDEILDGRHINQGKAEPYPISAPSDNMVSPIHCLSKDIVLVHQDCIILILINSLTLGYSTYKMQLFTHACIQDLDCMK